ncbi:hypothetical protein WCLP8_610002 [uncultured Gammaproteobacteria bacterium]
MNSIGCFQRSKWSVVPAGEPDQNNRRAEDRKNQPGNLPDIGDQRETAINSGHVLTLLALDFGLSMLIDLDLGNVHLKPADVTLYHLHVGRNPLHIGRNLLYIGCEPLHISRKPLHINRQPRQTRLKPPQDIQGFVWVFVAYRRLAYRVRHGDNVAGAGPKS